MMDLFDDSGEVIQNLWARIVCQNYPTYKDFWDEFIGERFAEDRLKHYEIEFPKEKSPENRKELACQYDDMSIVHYSIFYNFASTHYQIEQLKKALTNYLANEKEKLSYFLHWESFNSVYFYLGNIFYLLKKLYSRVLTIVNKKGNRKFEEYLIQNGLHEEYSKLSNSIKDIRDYMVHFSKIPLIIIQEEGFKIPPNLRNKEGNRENASVLLSQNNDEWLFTHVVVDSDLEAMEELVNKIDMLFLKELREFKSSGGIDIKYPENSVAHENLEISLPSLAAKPKISTEAGLYHKPEIKGSGDFIA